MKEGKTGEAMQEILESPEHHFLELTEKIKDTDENWSIFHFALSRTFDIEDLVSRPPETYRRALNAARQESDAFLKCAREDTEGQKEGFLYRFADNDILIAAHAKTKVEELQLHNLFKELCRKLGPLAQHAAVLRSDPYALHKLGDEKLLGMKKVEAWAAMADVNKVRSLAARRRRRAEPLVLIIEDDRFTASYTANILNKDYDIIHTRTGEEGLLSYIDNPPDLLFLDIHLPGLSGHQVLRAVQRIDPEGFVTMLSVDTEKSSVVTASDFGAHGFLKKPVSRERLLAAVLKSPHIRRHRRSVQIEGLPTQFN